MSKIRVIDLLNKITNGEEVPEKIKYKNELYVFNKNTETIDDLYRLNHTDGIDWLSHINIELTDDVEIIEEQPEIDIQNKNETNWEKIGEMVGKMYLEFAKGFNNALEQLGIELDNQINNK